MSHEENSGALGIEDCWGHEKGLSKPRPQYLQDGIVMDLDGFLNSSTISK